MQPFGDWRLNPTRDFYQRYSENSKKDSAAPNAPVEELPPPENFPVILSNLETEGNLDLANKMVDKHRRMHITLEQILPLFDFAFNKAEPAQHSLCARIIYFCIDEYLAAEIMRSETVLPQILTYFPAHVASLEIFISLFYYLQFFPDKDVLDMMKWCNSSQLLPHFVQFLQTQETPEDFQYYYAQFLKYYFDEYADINRNYSTPLFKYDDFSDAAVYLMTLIFHFTPTEDNISIFNQLFKTLATLCQFGPFAVTFLNSPDLPQLMETIPPGVLAFGLSKVIQSIFEPDMRVTFSTPINPHEKKPTMSISTFTSYTTEKINFEQHPILPFFLNLLESDRQNDVLCAIDTLGFMCSLPSVETHLFSLGIPDKLFEIISGDTDFVMKNEAIIFLLKFTTSRDKEQLDYLIERGVVDLIAEFFDQQHNFKDFVVFIDACYSLVLFSEANHAPEYRDLIFQNEDIYTTLTRMSDGEFDQYDEPYDHTRLFNLKNEAESLLIRENNQI